MVPDGMFRQGSVGLRKRQVIEPEQPQENIPAEPAKDCLIVHKFMFNNLTMAKGQRWSGENDGHQRTRVVTVLKRNEIIC